MSKEKWNARERLSAAAAKRAEEHDAWCKWPNGTPCRRFSTDGTRLGAEIAHTMGTTDETAITAIGISDLKNDKHLTGMTEEQADWEESSHDPLNCPDGDGCQDYGCISYWERRGREMYGDSDPSR